MLQSVFFSKKRDTVTLHRVPFLYCYMIKPQEVIHLIVSCFALPRSSLHSQFTGSALSRLRKEHSATNPPSVRNSRSSSPISCSVMTCCLSYSILPRPFTQLSLAENESGIFSSTSAYTLTRFISSVRNTSGFPSCRCIRNIPSFV